MEVTSRTLQGRFLLRPSKEANELILGILGRAQALYEVTIYAFVFLSNHFHLVMRADSVEQMASFLGFMKVNVAKELGELHEWEETFWGRRYSHIPVYDTEEDQMARLEYVFENGCKEDLVDSPIEWPGVSSVQVQVNGETEIHGTWYDRASQYDASLCGRRETFPKRETVELSPLPFMAEWSPEERQRYFKELVEAIEEKNHRRHANDGSSALGARGVLNRDPHDKPAEFHRSPQPMFHALKREHFWELFHARQEKLIAYRRAAERLKRGEQNVRFPEDCFPPRLPAVGRRTTQLE